MGLSLDLRPVTVLVSFQDAELLPSGIPDEPAEDLVDKIIRSVVPTSGVQVIPTQKPVDCSLLPVIFKHNRLKPVEWLHRVRLDDEDPKKRYHSIKIYFERVEASSLANQVYDWLEGFLRRQAVKVRGYENPLFVGDCPTDRKSASLNIDHLNFRCPPCNGKYRIGWTAQSGLVLLKK
jgi:hypothetical protein